LVVVYARTSYVQFWVRIYGLSQEYWRSRILFEKASGVCIWPLHTHVLVDVDISQRLYEEIMVERERYAFYVKYSL
jgi:hypothetical protein